MSLLLGCLAGSAAASITSYFILSSDWYRRYEKRLNGDWWFE